MLRLAHIQFDILILRIFADDHPLIDPLSGTDKQIAAVLCVIQAIGD